MKKIIIGGVLTLFMAGNAMAACSLDSSLNKSSLNQTLDPEVPQIIGWGNDEGGFYYILSDSDKCWKWYPKTAREDIPGMVD